MLSCRVMPVRWLSMSRSVTELVRLSLWNLIEGTESRTGASQDSLPSSTSMPAETAVKSLVFEAICTMVRGVNGSLLPQSR